MILPVMTGMSPVGGEEMMASPRETADAFTAALNAADFDKAAAFYAPDVVFVAPDAGELTGREQAGEHHRAFFQAFEGATVEIVGAHDAGNVTIDEWVFRGTHTAPLATPTGEEVPPTGRSIELHGADVQVHRDGAVTHHRLYFDQVELLRGLGLMPGG